jgi:hypothetical protein
MAKVHRTYWKVRERYRRLGLAGSALGLVVGAAGVATGVQSAEWWADGGEPMSLLGGIGLIASAVLAPFLLSRLAWRLHRRRFLEDIYRIRAH